MGINPLIINACWSSGFLNENWPGILTGILTGLFVSILIYFIQWLRKLMVTWKFKKYRGNYNCYRKVDNKRENLVSTITIATKGNKFVTKGIRESDNSQILGKIEMSLSIPDYGTGYYQHTDLDAWGFYIIQIKSREEILVHAPYNITGKKVNQAFVWIKNNKTPNNKL
jgi:hypothetical protein